MKDTGKSVESFNGNRFSDHSSSSNLPCRKHPSSSSIGICAFCLKDRLIKLVCSDCGEQRFSSCSCSDISSSYPSSRNIGVGSVRQIPFLIENEKTDIRQLNSKARLEEKSEAVVLLKRSSSSSAVVKRSRFWRFGRLFRKNREKGLGISGRNGGGFDEKGEMWVFDYMGVSRSRSLGGFRGCFIESEEVGFGGDNNSNGSSLVSANDFKSVKQGGFMELERDSNGVNRSDFSVAESGFIGVEDSGFIDLKLGFSSELKPELSGLKFGGFSNSESGLGILKGGDILEDECDSFGHLRDGIFRSGSSCRIASINGKGSKKSEKSLNLWKWISKHHSNGNAARKKDIEHV